MKIITDAIHRKPMKAPSPPAITAAVLISTAGVGVDIAERMKEIV